MGNKPNIVRNTIIYALGDIVPRLFSLITFPILTSYLLPKDYGIINYVVTVNNFLMILGILSLNTYYLVQYYKCKDEQEQKKLLGNLDLFIISINFIFTIILFFVGPKIMQKWGSEVDFYPYMAIGLGISFFNIFRYLPSALFRLQERPLPLTILNILSGFFTLVGSLIAVICIKAEASSVLYSNLIVTFIFAVIFFIITSKNAIWSINWNQIKTALKFSIPLVPGNIAIYMYTAFDRILIERELNLTAVGIYSTAATLALLLNIVSYGAYQAFEPYFFKTYGKPDFISAFIKVRNTLLFVCLTGAMCLSVFAAEFFKIFTSEAYHICYIYVPLICLGAIASAMGRMYSTIVVAKGRTKISALIMILGAVFSVTFNYFMLPVLDIWSACLSYFITFLLILLLYIFYSEIRIPHGRVILGCVFYGMVTFLLTYTVDEPDTNVSILIKAPLVILSIYLISIILKVNMFTLTKRIFAR